MPAFDPQPFTLSIDEDEISDLRRRIVATRWPTPTPGDPWSQGTDLNYLRGFLRFWADEFDWSQQQRLLNELQHFRCEIDGVRLHYIHERARNGIGVPLILTHGWPSCFVEYVKLIPLLTDPKSHGIDGPAFDVVVPSLPGYGFSERPDAVGVNYAYVARLWNQLMTNLGYSRFGAHGGDFGSGVSTMMALQEPDRLLGLHLTNLDIGHFDPGEQPWTTAEKEFLEELDRWAETERGYSAIQSTKPQTLGYGLNDSPVGLAAWILEKWRSWTDSDGDPALRLSRDFLATLLTIYWATGSITSSMRDYFDNRWHGVEVNPSTYVGVPTAIAVFDHHFVPEPEPPREWVERLYNVRRWSEMPAGGHFAPIEQPRLVAQDLAGFFADLAAPQDTVTTLRPRR